MESKKKTKAKTLKDIYEDTQEKNPLKLAKLSGKSVAYVKSFLKKSISELEVVSSSKIDLKNVDFVPAGSGYDNHYQADITFMHDYKRLKDNKKHIGILTVLNTATRKAYARSIKSTEGNGVANAMEEMIDEIENMEHLRTDNGVEFQGKFKALLEDRLINHEIAEAHTHNWLARTNRFHRTLKETIKTLFAINKNKIWYPHLQGMIDDYNDTPSYAFRNVESLKHEPKTMKGKPYYRPVAPNMVENSGPKFLSKVHEHEKDKAAAVKKVDGLKLKVGDHVRLLNPLTKEQIKLNGKFAKKSLNNSWTTRVYKIIQRTGPNFWRIDDDSGEIKQWATYMLKKTTQNAYESQTEAVKTKEKENKQIRVSRAINKEERFISADEKKDLVIGDISTRILREKKAPIQKAIKPKTPPIKKKKKPVETYIIEKIVDKKTLKGKVYYLVKWKGYSKSSNTWEPQTNLKKDVPDLIKGFQMGKKEGNF